MEQQLSRRQMIAELTRSPHGNLEAYLPVTTRAASFDSEFLSHLIAWNEIKGSIRDSKVALPLITLTYVDAELRENALAHLAKRNPRDLMRAVRFAQQRGGTARLRPMIEKYVRARERQVRWWTRTAVQYRRDFKSLYATFRLKPDARAEAILFKGEKPKGSYWEVIAKLSQMRTRKAQANAIRRFKIPFLVANPALGKNAENPEVLAALLSVMSQTEIVTNMKRLKKLGVDLYPETRAILEERLNRKGSNQATFKATVAAEVLGDTRQGRQLRGTQERQLDAVKGMQGDWLILGDKSGSMHAAIEKTRVVVATLARMTEGRVHLIWFDEDARYADATGLSYEALCDQTRRISDGGRTAIGQALLAARRRNIEADGIILVSDGGENIMPRFVQVYQDYCQHVERDVALYFLRIGAQKQFTYAHLGRRMMIEADQVTPSLEHAGVAFTAHDIDDVDHYALITLVETLRANPYSLVDEIFNVPLLTVDGVLGMPPSPLRG